MLSEEEQLKLTKQLTTTVVRLEVMAERHQGEHLYHIRRTNFMVRMVSLFLALLAVVNIYYLTHFSTHMFSIVDTIQALDKQVVTVSSNMIGITDTMINIDNYMSSMGVISHATISLSGSMIEVGKAMQGITGSMTSVSHEMNLVNQSMDRVNLNFYNMRQSVDIMSVNVRQFAKPMGMMNNMLP
ncbi:MAG: hypothetical protein HQL49_04115 [Gammaproteobacteria bacterium]|nr:hypothetical protein [Gammaproteobacteria bacterium]